MANILILNGVSRKNGNTATLIKAFSEGAVSAGNQVKEFYLQTMDIHGCLGVRAAAELQRGLTTLVCRRMRCLRSTRLS